MIICRMALEFGLNVVALPVLQSQTADATHLRHSRQTLEALVALHEAESLCAGNDGR